MSQAIKAGRSEEALKFLNYGSLEGMRQHDGIILWLSMMLNYLAANFGEQEVEKALRVRYLPRVKEWLNTLPDVREAFIGLRRV